MQFFTSTQPGVPHYVIDDLSDLAGKASGSVLLPVELDWSGDNIFDLSERGDVITLCETVLRAGRSEELISAHLNAGHLREVWGELQLAPELRKAWEMRHPSLTASTQSR